MNISYAYKNDKAIKKANMIAKYHGYDGYSSIDDPVLREFIWHHASKDVKTNIRFNFSIFELFTTVILCFVLGLLLGIII